MNKEYKDWRNWAIFSVIGFAYLALLLTLIALIGGTENILKITMNAVTNGFFHYKIWVLLISTYVLCALLPANIFKAVFAKKYKIWWIGIDTLWKKTKNSR